MLPVKVGLGLGSSLFTRRYLGNNYYSIFLRLMRCFTSAGALSESSSEQSSFAQLGFPIRKFPDHRLLHTSPRHIAVTPRPSSLFDVKASTIRPYFHCRFAQRN